MLSVPNVFIRFCCFYLVLAAGAVAQTFTYPVQEFRIGIGNTDRNVAVPSTTTGTALSSATQSGTRSEKWYLNYVSAGVYEIVNSQSGLVITNDNGSITQTADGDTASQRWSIVGVENDFEGFTLYYKIVNASNASLALTFDSTGNTFAMATYDGRNFQKFKLNLDGLEGYASNSSIGGKEKAGTIGGLLGATVFVSTTAQLIAALDRTDPLTVVLTADVDLVNQDKTKQRIRDNKTLVGSYANNTIYDSQLRNDDFNGADASPSNNIVIRNVNFVARTLNSTGSGVILIFIYCGRNIWVDHNNFSATFAQNKDVEVGKFMWINTPSANWSDGAYNGINPDYITISYNYFKNRYWTLAFGSQNKDVSRLRTTVMFNKWEQCSRRTPQYSNGFHHSYSDYHTVTNGSNANASSQIIGGEGSRVLSENNRFEAYTGKEIDIDRSLALAFSDNGSYTASTTSSTPTKLSTTSLGTAWKASDSYGYTLVPGYAANGKDAKAFSNLYSGCFKSYANIKYITDADLADYVGTAYKSPFLRSVTVGIPTNWKTGTIFNVAHRYTFRNANSQMFMVATGAIAAVATNVSQGTSLQSWTLADAGDGFYSVYSEVGDAKTYFLDVQGGNPNNGANIALGNGTPAVAQFFKFVANSDGTFNITTKVSKDTSCLGVAASSMAETASVVQWSCNGAKDQAWSVSVYVPPLQGSLIRNLVVADTANYSDWKVQSSQTANGLIFGDREMTYVNMPDELLGAEAILTAADSKSVTGDQASFVAGADMTVYVALDNRVATVPAWLSKWTKTSLTTGSSTGVVFDIYSANVSADSVVVLGTNGQSAGCVNYTVFAVVKPVANMRSTNGVGLLTARLFRQGLQIVQVQPGIATLTVYSITGTRIATFPVSGVGEYYFTWDRPLANGLYLLDVQSSGNKQVLRFLVDKN